MTIMEKEIYFAGGCFWGAEHFLKQIEGVTFTEVGFANGDTPAPTYKEVCTDTTGYAETVRVRYNPLKVSLRFLLEMFFKSIDPTSRNCQGEDCGTQYRTGIYFVNSSDEPLIRYMMCKEAEKHELPLQVEVLPLSNFYRAEEYHQNYLVNNPNGYCHLPVGLFEYARNNRDTETVEKNEKYLLLLKQAKGLSDGETDDIALMANTSALLHETFHFWWTGYYRVVGEELVLGPFQGPVACMRIAFGRGVCGTAWQQQHALVVPEVEKFPGHIACSADSRSEIVVPVYRNGRVMAVLDIDSQYFATFDDCDRHWLEKLMQELFQGGK